MCFELYDGPVVATLQRQGTGSPAAHVVRRRQIHLLAKRDGVIGAALFNPFCVPVTGSAMKRAGDVGSRRRAHRSHLPTDPDHRRMSALAQIGTADWVRPIFLTLNTASDLALLADALPRSRVQRRRHQRHHARKLAPEYCSASCKSGSNQRSSHDQARHRSTAY